MVNPAEVSLFSSVEVVHMLVKTARKYENIIYAIYDVTAGLF